MTATIREPDEHTPAAMREVARRLDQFIEMYDGNAHDAWHQSARSLRDEADYLEKNL